MTEAQLKKLDDAVLHRDIGIYNERLKTLKADLIREAHRHEEDFTIIEGDRSPALKFGIFVAFAMIYPRVELFLRIIAEWIALILTGAFIPFNCSPTTRGSDLAVVWTSIGAAFLFIELRGAGPELAWWNNLKARPRRASESDDVYASIDPILDKISKFGIGNGAATRELAIN